MARRLVRRVPHWGFSLLAVLAVGACAEEREPISQVQPNALEKAFFVGSLADLSDDPEFYTAASVIDVPFGADAGGVFPGLVGGLRRVKFEITEDYLLARMTYEEIEGTDGHGSRTTNNGRVIAAFPITSHFDIKRAYNSSTGEEINVVVENSSDRPWYERAFMRVDWSANQVVSSFHWDPMAQNQAFGESVGTEPLAYNVSDPNHADAPMFDLEGGYFDVTNRVYLSPRQVTIEGQTVTACLYRGSFVLGGSSPWGNCENSEVTLRYSFRRIAQPGEPGFTDYEPMHWDGERMNAFGIFTQDRLGEDDRYGIVDNKWFRFAGRHNIWQRSHTDVACDVLDAQVAPSTHTNDTDRNGTHDVCEAAGAGSRCDDFVGKCTIPYAQREVRAVPWHYTVQPEGDAVIRDFTRKATIEWDVALRVAVQAARLVECRKTSGASLAGTQWEGQSCEAAFPMVQADDAELKAVMAVYDCWDQAGYGAASCAPSDPNSVAAMRPVIAFCDNPVPPGADPACGPAGTQTRFGDIRYHHLAVWDLRQSAAPWGYGPSLSDPLTGEIISIGVNVYNIVTHSAAQSFVDQLRWLNGEIKSEDISNGSFIKDWAAAADASSLDRIMAGGTMLPEEELQRRMLAVTGVTPSALTGLAPTQGTGAWAVQPQIPSLGIDVNRLKADLGRSRLPVDFAESPRAIFDQRIAAAKDSPIEAQLTNALWGEAAGPDASPTEASPLRTLHPRVAMAAQRQLQSDLARIGQCMVGAPEPTGLPALAKIMARKFPLADGASAAESQARIDRMRDYLRGRMHYSVILHEMGHTVGFRHNFVSSYDSTNYRPQYWQLRTDNGRVTQRCTGPTPNGENCIGPRYFDGLTQAELDNSIWTWQHTTVMDYPGELTQDMLGLGVYDYAGARMFYADVVDVAADPALLSTVPNSEPRITGTPTGDIFVETVDNMGGLVGQIIEDPQNPNRFTHYSERHNLFNLIRNCRPADVTPPPNWSEERDGVYDPVFDGKIVLETVCDRMPVDYVAYADMVPDRLTDSLNIDPRFFTARRSRDATGRPRMPYGFESDEYADGWSPSTYRHDNGADLYEELTFHSNLYENRHIWDNFRNGRSTFSVGGAYNRAISRYHVKISELTQGVAYLFGWYFKEAARTSGATMDDVYAGTIRLGLFQDMIIGAGLGFDHFMRVLTRPHVGIHEQVDINGDRRPDILEPTEDVIDLYGSNSLFQTVAMPNGTMLTDSGDVMFGGRPLNNGFDSGNGYWGVDYLGQVGSYYEKALVTELMLSAGYNVINFYRFDGIDGRFHHNNFTDMWPDAMRRMIGSMLTGDRLLYAPRLSVDPVTGDPEAEADRDQPALRWPKRPMGWVSYNFADGPEICWPANGVLQCRDGVGTPIDSDAPSRDIAVDPQLGYEVQKFIAFWSYVYMPVAEENDWVDSMRIYVVGKDQNPDYLPAERVEWRDPVSGARYIARKYGNETLLGRTYDKGIAAKMVQWANQLTERAYEVESVDPITGAVTVRLDLDGQPVLQGVAPTCAESKACNDLRAYRGLMDFMRDTAARLGFPEPALQIFGWGESNP